MRTVFSIDALGGIDPITDAERLTVRVVRSPFNVEKAHVARPLLLGLDDLPDWSTPDAVRARGRKVRDSLSQHPGVAQVLGLLYATPVGQRQPLYLMLSESEAEQFCWETLCDPKDHFIALDSRWPVARIIDPMNGIARPPAEMRMPIRVMAVISAFGVPTQLREWEMLRDAVLRARKGGLAVQVKVLVGDPALRQAIDQEIAAGLAGVESGAIDKTPARVLGDIAAWSPQILHFFCHGRADLGDQSIELATALDHADPAATAGSVRIGAQQLVERCAQLDNPWLLSLNCCSSGMAAKNLQSLASKVVAAAFPAAVAMLEPVDASDAYEFTRAFYQALFAGFGRVVEALKASTRTTFEWSEAMVDARTAICDLHDGDAPNAHAWTLPVLYVRGIEPFAFERPHDLPEAMTGLYKARAQLIAEWLQTIGLQKSEAERIEILKRTLNDVPQPFWPRPDGTFAG
ncbi:CHAT domain-containing protein [Azohydromonas australica]|uniref:CHAT domain-containing protein n=1 Tax=Azohydromonas australica TaxID=364039 RepID=UPI0004243880|nr:CHAT domain-containing protein [Azohydromonas australica]